jgi:hypothetical protein
MKLVWLTEKNEMEGFREHFVVRGKNPIEFSYLQTARVRGFMLRGMLVGGYIINTHGPLRYETWIPNDDRKTAFIQKFFRDGACEITCIWIDRDKISKVQRNLIYLMSVIDALAQRKRWIVGGATNPKVAAIQKQVLRRVIYRGKVLLPDLPQGEVYCSSWLQLASCMFLAFFAETAWDLIKLAFRRGSRLVRFGFTGKRGAR